MNIEEILRDVIHDIVSEVAKDIPDDAKKDIHEMALLSARIHDRITKAKAISLEDVRRFNVLCYQRFDKIQDGEEFTKEEPTPEIQEPDFRFDFGEAIRLMKKGHRVARDGWNGKNMCVAYQKGYPQGVPANKNTAKAWGMKEGDLFRCRPYLQMKCADGTFQMWLATQSDILAEDWHVVEDGV